jgi:transketolase
MVEKASSGHPGGPMGGADFIHVLYSEYLRFDPDNLEWRHRDRFFLDPGHMSAMLYSQLHLIGALSMDDLTNFRQWKSPTPGHPEVDTKRGIENTSGPLGLGHAFGAGAAVAERFLAARFGEWMSHYTYLYISDGGVQEEISQGVGRLAGHLGLGKLIMFYDANDIQLSTEVDEVMTEDTAAKYEAWGWHVITIDGNDHDAIRDAIEACQDDEDRPSLIIGKTIMGLGAVKADGSSHEGQVETHGKPLGKSNASFPDTIKHLGGDPDQPFAVFADVAEHYKVALDEKRADVAEQAKVEAAWRASNPGLAAKMDDFYDGVLPELDWHGIALGENEATRNASSKVLGYMADHVENMIVSSADLSNSDKTDGFLKKSSAFAKGDFTGGFLQAGVSELTMAAMCTGMALHGGVIPVCATFFAFSDYMKPVLRVAALMETPVKFLWTHDAFRVGEDGPTHQPIEQEAQLRLLEQLHNHSGRRSFVALRPADSAEAVACWQQLLELDNRPGGLILSRQNIKDLPAKGNTTRRREATQAEKGGYLVYGDPSTAHVTLVANGSEVATLIDAIDELEAAGIKPAIASVPSEGLFRDQDVAYQGEVIDDSKPVFGLTAGLPVTLQGLVGAKGKVFGMQHFGYSAPYTVLDEKFGYTSDNVVQQVKDLLGK